jgi:hypothetical protein
LALFVLIIVAIVVFQTWKDWKLLSKNWVIPDWLRGVALGGVLAISIAAMSSYATAWIEDPAARFGDNAISSRVFWPQLALVAISGTVILLMTRKKRLPWMILLAGMVLAAFWVGAVLGS